MVAIGSKIFDKKQDMATAWKLVEGDLWGYENSPNGIMPEIMSLIPCKYEESCSWDEQRWKDGVALWHQQPTSTNQRILHEHMPEGVIKVDDARYILR
jgi:mannosyl-oligosaccharide alpha-1,2-mannosidase